jgi:hypothetical protein
MKTATSLLLGAALATAFFLLYTSLCRDLNGGPQPPPPQQQQRRWEKKATEAGAAGGDREVRHPNPKQQEGVAEEVVVVTRGDGDRGDGATAGEKANRGAEEKRQQVTTRLPLSPSFSLAHNYNWIHKTKQKTELSTAN